MLKKMNVFFLLGLFLFSSIAQAGFDIIGDDELESNPGKYGRAHTVPFRKAMSGDESISLNEDKPLADPSALATDIPKIGHTWFIAAHLGRPHTKLKNITASNTATGGGAVSQNKTSESDSLFNLSLSWGYRWIKWAWNLEFLATEGMDLNLNLNTGGTAYTSNNKADNYLFFLNLHYFFPRYFNWMPEALAPHVNFGLGPNIQRTKSDLLLANQVIASKSKSRFQLAWNFTFGVAYRITNNFLVDLSWRYIDYGDAKFGPATATGFKSEVKADDFTSNGLYFGLFYEMD